VKKFLLFIAGSALFLSGCSNAESELNDFMMNLLRVYQKKKDWAN